MKIGVIFLFIIMLTIVIYFSAITRNQTTWPNFKAYCFHRLADRDGLVYPQGYGKH